MHKSRLIKKINKYGKVYQLREYLKHNNEINIVYPYEEIMKAKENSSQQKWDGLLTTKKTPLEKIYIYI